MRIKLTAHFERSFRRLPPLIQHQAAQQVKVFRQNQKDHRLKTHKLKGKLVGLWSFSVTHKHRILFEFMDKDTVLFHDIGDHKVYK